MSQLPTLHSFKQLCPNLLGRKLYHGTTFAFSLFLLDAEVDRAIRKR